jgi:class 3 adenylate cyclase/tetratricopeptide (TPR) repeat protein
MLCPRCQHDNPADGHFCQSCGARLEAPCAGCAELNHLGAKFCKKCGQRLGAEQGIGPRAGPRFGAPSTYTPKHLVERILTSKSALEGERKQVTVLFADVTGFTSLAEELDPEEVHGLMARVLDLMLVEVHRYEGTVNQFLGDGIMALFGAPLAHEDHAVRAVYTALGIRKALEAHRGEVGAPHGITIQVRQGLNTGLVVVGAIGSDLRMDYTAVGDTTNVAARLQQTAEPGRILISETTHRLAHRRFETRSVGDLRVKGKAKAVRAWEVVAPRAGRTRLDIEAERGLTPFVGRTRELRVLTECFQRASAQQGQVVFLVGEPGIGKSRLLVEFRQQLGDAAIWNEGRCLSFGQAIAFHPLVDLLRRTAGIEEADSDAAIIEKLERHVRDYGEDLAPALPWLRYLLSVDPGHPRVLAQTPQERRSEVFDALRRLTLRAAQRAPQVVVFEDLHWIDPATEQYVVRLADGIPTSRVLLLVTYRPGYQHPFGDRTHHTRISPGPLSTEESVRMAQAILATAQLPAELEALVIHKAEGNPFYVEEVLRSLHEIGAIRQNAGHCVFTRPLDTVRLPDTIQDLVSARIDRLEDAPKRLLQLGAVIGREFPHRLIDLLAEVPGRTDEFLRELKALDLIYEKSRFPELAYMFKHAVTQDVAYGSLLIQRRRELHRRVGFGIEELYPDRLAEHYEVLAHHFARAEAWDRAVDYFVRAGEKSAKAFALREALGLYTEALDIAARLGEAMAPTMLIAIHKALSSLHFGLAAWQDSRLHAERVLELARRTNDAAAEATALGQIAQALLWAEDFDQAIDYGRQAMEVAERTDTPGALASALEVIGIVTAVTSPTRLEQSRGHFSRALAIGRSIEDATRQAMALYFLGNIKNWQSAFRDAHGLTSQGVEIARAQNAVIPFLRCVWGQAVSLVGTADYDQALHLLEEGLALAEKIGDGAFIPRFQNTLGWLHIECDDLDRGLELSRLGLEPSRQARHATGVERVAYIQNNRGDAFLAKGDLHSASEVLEEVRRLTRDTSVFDWMRWRCAIHNQVSLGELALARGDPAEAIRWADQSLEAASATESRKYIVRAWRLKGEAARTRRAAEEAERSLRTALALAMTLDAPRELWRTYAALGGLYAETKRPDEATSAYETARRLVDRVLIRLHDPRLRTALEGAPLIQEIRQASRSA